MFTHQRLKQSVTLIGGAIYFLSVSSAIAQEIMDSSQPAQVAVGESNSEVTQLVNTGDDKVINQTAGSNGSDGNVLPEVKVKAKKSEETAKRRIRGYVAKRSTAGTKTDTPIIETPQAISVITRDRMDEQGITNINEALRYSAGISSDTYGADTRSDWYTTVRGLNANFYLDNLQLPVTKNYASWRVDPYMVDRVELLRGPASVLYGQGAPGGTINLVSKLPTKTEQREIEFQVGSFGRKQLGIDLSGPIDQSGKFLYRLVAVGKDAKNQVAYVKDRRWSFAPSLTWQPNDQTSLTIMGTYQQDDTKSSSSFFPAQGTVLANPNGRIAQNLFVGDPDFDKYLKTQKSFAYQFEHQLNSQLKLRQNARYSQSKLDYQSVYGVGVDNTDWRTLNRVLAVTNPSAKRFVLDNQLEAKFSTGSIGHTVLFGIDYQQQKSNENLRYGLAPTLDLFNSIYTPITSDYLSDDVTYRDKTQQKQRQLGFYVQDQIKLTPQLMLNLGLRHDMAKTVLDTTSTTPDLFAEPSTEKRVTTKDNKTTGRVGLLYASNLGLSPYANYSTSFLPTSGTDQNGNPFKPTTGRQFEIGVKYQPKAANMMVNFALFDIKQNNVLTTDPTNSLYSIQTGQQRSRGAEFEINANLTKQLKLISAYTYQHVINSKANDESYDKHPTDVPVPRNFGSFWLDYTFDDGWLDGFGLGAGVRYIGRTAGNPNNTLNVPSFSLLDVGAHYTTGNWRFALNASNLSDKRYVSGCQNENTCFYGARRNILFSVKYRF